jgi:hypothetical protein
MALITGWNRSTWNAGAWNSPIPVEVTGVSAASATGSVTITLPVSISVTGVSAASAIGSASVTVSVTVSVSGVSAATAVGSSSIITNVNLSVTGVSAASDIGSIQVNFAFSVEGVSAEGICTNALVWSIIDASQTSGFSEISTTQTPDWTEIAA